MRSPVRDTSQICMVLHDIVRCLILFIPLQEPNMTQNEVSQKFEKNGHHRDAVPQPASPHYEAILVQIVSASFLAKEEPHF